MLNLNDKKVGLDWAGAFPLLKRYLIVGRYLVTGAIGATINIGLLYILTDKMAIWYLVSEVIAFIVAMNVSFFLQKYWTFKNLSKSGIRNQAVGYFSVGIANLFVNAFLIYLFVEFFAVWYILSQVLASVFVAISSFFMYKCFIFRAR